MKLKCCSSSFKSWTSTMAATNMNLHTNSPLSFSRGRWTVFTRGFKPPLFNFQNNMWTETHEHQPALQTSTLPPLAKYASLWQDRVNRPFPVSWWQWEVAHVHTVTCVHTKAVFKWSSGERWASFFLLWTSTEQEIQEATWMQEFTSCQLI